MTLLEMAESGDLAALTKRLADVVGGFGAGRSQMTESEQLIDEALTYARLGDLDEATFRLRLRAKPKWHSKEQCERAYEKAMGRP